MHRLTAGDVELRVLSSIEDVEGAGEAWRSIEAPPGSPPPHPFSNHDYFTQRLARRKDFIRPHVLLLREGGRTGVVPAMLVQQEIRWNVGGKSVLRSHGRVLRVSNGGMIGLASRASAEAAVMALRAVLAQREADLVYLHELPDGSALAAAARSVPFLARDHFARLVPGYTLELPETYEEFYRARSANTRKALARARSLTGRTLADPRVVRYDRTEDLERIVTDSDAIAAGTYQRRIGVGFRDIPATREFVAWALRKGWLHAHLLYDGDHPVAFSHLLLYRGTLHLRDTGFDPAYASCRPGTALLTHIIEESCARPEVTRVDFGAMDAEYKRQLSTSRFELVSMYIFPVTARGMLMQAKRSATGATERLARAVLGSQRARNLARKVRSLRG